MKQLPIFVFLLSVAVCSAGEMVRNSDADFKRLADDRAAKLAELHSTLDLSKPDDRDFLERVEQQFYGEALLEISGSYFRTTRLKLGDDWQALWNARRSESLADMGGDRTSRDSLAAAFELLREFEDDQDARILERVVKAKFGGEPAWMLLVHWEREDVVQKDLTAGKETELGHFLIIGVRCSDRKLVARIQCG